MKQAVISVDVGTSSLRSVLFDCQGNILAKAQEELPLLFPQEGYVEQAPLAWRGALLRTLAKIAAAARAQGVTIAGISATTLRSAVFAVNRSGEAISNAILWYDKRCAAICERVKPMEERIYSLSGLRVDPMFSAPKMLWLKEACPDLYRSAYKLLGAYEYIYFQLCGVFVTDPAIAGRTMLYNLHQKQWDSELLSIFNLNREKLCDIGIQGGICGHTKGALIRESGLPEGIPVVLAGGDQQCGSLGLGVTQSGRLSIVTGTGGYITALSDSPVLDASRGFLCNPASIPGKFILELPVLTAGNLYQWFVKEFIGEACYGGNCYDMADQMAACVAPGAMDLMVFPYFKGAGAPHWVPDAKGAIVGMTLAHGKKELARAILEGIALELVEDAALLEKALQIEVQSIYVSGGLSHCVLYNQILADASGKTILLGNDCESTGWGAAISTLCAVGLKNGYADSTSDRKPCVQATGETDDRKNVYYPIAENHAFYREFMKRRRRMRDTYYSFSKATGVEHTGKESHCYETPTN